MGSRAAEFGRAQVFSPQHVLLPDISYQSFTYPGDQEALTALTRIPGASSLLAYLQEHFTEQMILVENSEQMLRAGPRSFKSLYTLLTRCSEILSLSVPDLYITRSPAMNAYTVGHRKTCIVLNSALIEGLTADELSFVIGHELGHIKCGHGLYRQLGDILIQYWDAAAAQIPVPGIALVRIPLLLAYWEWYRRAEFTCDRAGLLCLQNLKTSQSALVKLAGHVHGFEDEIDIDSAIEQTHVHKDVNKLVQIISIFEHIQNTHPFVPARLRELKAFAESSAYDRLLGGQYERDQQHLHEGGRRVECPGCGKKLNSTLAYCPDCGSRVGRGAEEDHHRAMACGSCGRAMTAGTKWCTTCGAEQGRTGPDSRASGFDKIKSNFGFGKR